MVLSLSLSGMYKRVELSGVCVGTAHEGYCTSVMMIGVLMRGLVDERGVEEEEVDERCG